MKLQSLSLLFAFRTIRCCLPGFQRRLLPGCFGLYVLIWGARSRLKFHGLAFVFASWFAVLCYTGYGCTERSYDQEVFYTYRALPPAPDADSPQVAARVPMASSTSE